MPAARPITGTNLVGGTPYSANAWGDGTHDDTTVLQAALTACGLINIPSGTYRTTSTLTIPANSGSGMIGDAVGYVTTGAANNVGVTIYADFTGSNAINNNCANPTIKRMEVYRHGTAAAGVYGVDMGAANVNGVIEDVMSWGHNKGFYLRASGAAVCEGCHAESNASDGFVIEGPWALSQTMSQDSGGRGYVLQGTTDSGDLDGLSEFQSAGNSMDITTMKNVRLTNSFFGGSTTGTAYGITCTNTNAAGKNNQFTHCYAEGIPQYAMFFGANTRENFLTNTVAGANAGGILNSSAALTVQGGWCTGANTNAYNVLVTAGTVLIAGMFGSSAVGNPNYGIGATVAATFLTAIGNYISLNSTPTDINCANSQIGNY